jgi:hemerythrin HHE cation binding domain-containing protein
VLHNTALEIDPTATSDWSRELRARLERHPREMWRRDSAPAVEFWLDVHDGFRRETDTLASAADAYRHGRLTACDLAALDAPRLGGMVARLHGHHEVEDFRYFPTFRRLEPRLAGGFDSLADDHLRLETHVRSSLAALRELLSAADAIAASEVARGHAAERYVRQIEDLCRVLVRHLRDEEDLIIPLLLDRGPTDWEGYFSG